MTIAISPGLTTPQLNRYVTEIPQTIAREQVRKTALYSLASKVCLAAFIAIAATVLSISLGLLSLHPALIFALILSTIPLQMGFQMGMMRSLTCSAKADEAKELAKELDQVLNWRGPQIEAFFKNHKLSLDKLPMHLLQRLNPADPLRVLLPAIAHYTYLWNQTKIHVDEHLKNLHNTADNPILKYQGRKIGWRILEYSAIPTALQAALVLQIISQPTLQTTLDDLGICRAKEFDERRFDQLLDGTDDYFVFHDASHPTLTFATAHEMVSTQDIDGLRVKLFS